MAFDDDAVDEGGALFHYVEDVDRGFGIVRDNIVFERVGGAVMSAAGCGGQNDDVHGFVVLISKIIEIITVR
jgi:hypothetical protein